jgi:hypothetical protein
VTLVADMTSIPVPELIAVLVIWLMIFGVRVLLGFGRRRRPSSSIPRAGAIDIHNERQRARLFASSAGLALISIPLILKVVPPNGSYGFRTPLARSSPEVWYAANAFMGWALVVAAAISATLLATLPMTARRWALWLAFLLPIACAVVASFLYLQRIV